MTDGAGTIISTPTATGDVSIRTGQNQGGADDVAISVEYNAGFRVNNVELTGGSSTSMFVGYNGDANSTLWSTDCYNRTGTTAANVFVDASGRIRRSTSSRRYKTDIQAWESGLAAVLNLRPVSFAPISDIATDRVRVVGFIAEDVNEVAPDIVLYGPDPVTEEQRIESINYNGVIAMLVNATQELAALVDSLTDRVAVLEERIARTPTTE